VAQWTEFGTPESRQRLAQSQDSVGRDWVTRLRAADSLRGTDSLQAKLRRAGAHGVLTINWSNYPGINKVFGSWRQVVPTLDVSCEDYGMLARLAENDQGARIRVTADAQFLGEQPVFNTIAEIKGSEKPNEYVMLSAHFDSWDGSAGATDNATGTVVMMEAIRILRQTYPNPKRTILVGHWGGEEQGLNGSRAFTEDHAEVVRGLHALFNQDNGTGRITSMSPTGLANAGPVLRGYLSQIPQQITQHIRFSEPGSPAGGGSDHASFICHGAPAFSLGALGWDYSNTTWHTNRDTYDKIVREDLINNAVLTAMLVYLASEDPTMMPRERANVTTPQGQAMQWPACAKATRRTVESSR
jgi:hypothetical protein